jgi:hypothetical protein
MSQEQAIQCPKCGSTEVRSSHSEKNVDSWFETIGRHAFRCRGCRTRFHARVKVRREPKQDSEKSVGRTRHPFRRLLRRIPKRTQIEVLVLLGLILVMWVFIRFITQERAPGSEGRLAASHSEMA